LGIVRAADYEGRPRSTHFARILAKCANNGHQRFAKLAGQVVVPVLPEILAAILLHLGPGDDGRAGRGACRVRRRAGAPAAHRGCVDKWPNTPSKESLSGSKVGFWSAYLPDHDAASEILRALRPPAVPANIDHDLVGDRLSAPRN